MQLCGTQVHRCAAGRIHKTETQPPLYVCITKEVITDTWEIFHFESFPTLQQARKKMGVDTAPKK